MMPEKTSEYIQFISFHKPALKDGEYTIKINQTIKGKGIPENPGTKKILTFSVAGERYSLNPMDVGMVFPPEGSVADHSNCFPHIVLNRSTLPWERQHFTHKNQESSAPWLALLLFTDDEMKHIDTEIQTLEKSGFPFDDEIGQLPTDKLTILKIDAKLLKNIVPDENEMSLLTHVRKGCDANEKPIGNEQALVICNRLPKKGEESTMHLVSMEMNPFEKLDEKERVTLVSLASWKFTCPDHYKITQESLDRLKQGITILIHDLQNYRGSENFKPFVQKFLEILNTIYQERLKKIPTLEDTDEFNKIYQKAIKELNAEKVILDQTLQYLPNSWNLDELNWSARESLEKAKDMLTSNIEFLRHYNFPNYINQATIEAIFPAIHHLFEKIKSSFEDEYFNTIYPEVSKAFKAKNNDFFEKLQLKNEIQYFTTIYQESIEAFLIASDKFDERPRHSEEMEYFNTIYQELKEALCIANDLLIKRLQPLNDIKFLYNIYQDALVAVKTVDDKSVLVEKLQPLEGTEYFKKVDIKAAFNNQKAEESEENLSYFHFGTFTSTLKHLNRRPSTLRLPDKNDEVNAYLQSGFVPAPHFFRKGAKSVSWYHSPLATKKHSESSFEFPVKAADALYLFDKASGMFDISYASAWELGRLWALANKRFSTELFQWKRKHSHDLHAAEQMVVHQSDHLPVVATGGDLIDLPDIVKTGFSELRLLKGIPFNYLVPEEEMLPVESIRFFYIDELWMDCLLDGAFSIGRVTEKDHAHDILRKPMTNLTLDYEARTGFIMRSDVISGWPDMIIEGYDTSNNQLTINRTQLSENVVLCIFEGEIDHIVMHLKPESIHFGLDVVIENNEEINYKKTTRGENNRTINEIPFRRNDVDRVVDIKRLFDRLLPSHSGFDSAHFGYQMVEDIEKVVFKRTVV
jgi:hypothetical protein